MSFSNSRVSDGKDSPLLSIHVTDKTPVKTPSLFTPESGNGKAVNTTLAGKYDTIANLQKARSSASSFPITFESKLQTPIEATVVSLIVPR